VRIDSLLDIDAGRALSDELKNIGRGLVDVTPPPSGRINAPVITIKPQQRRRKLENLHDMAAALRNEPADVVVAVLAVYPKGVDTGLLPEQGAFTERLLARVRSGVEVSRYRIMWSQVGFFIRGTNVDEFQRAIAEGISECRDRRLEVRTVIFPLRGALDERVARLDDAQGELSSRRNFGSGGLRGVQRLVDSVRWP
jgi:hypothetical protein